MATQNLYQFIDENDEIDAQEVIKQNEMKCQEIRKLVEKDEVTCIKSIKRAQIEVKNDTTLLNQLFFSFFISQQFEQFKRKINCSIIFQYIQAKIYNF